MNNWRKYDYKENPQYKILKKWQEKKEYLTLLDSEREVKRIIKMVCKD